MGDVEHPAWLKSLPVAPEFRPTEAEFVDPISYIFKIEEIARQYGICKIIPPYTKAAKKVVVNNLNRSLSSFNASGNVVNGSGLRQSRRMGRFMCGSQLTKPKSVVLDSSSVETEYKEPCGNVLNKEPLGKAKFATRKQQLGWNFKRARGVAHSQNHKLVWQSGESYTLEQFEARAKVFARSRLGSVKDVSNLGIETLFWRAAADKPISVEYANDIPGSAFSESTDSAVFNPVRFRKRKRWPEDADQKIGSKFFLRHGSMDFCWEGEDGEEEAFGDGLDPSDASKSRSGALDTAGDNGGGAGSRLANSAWNMRNVARSNGSLLRYMPEEVPGVTTPMVYIGMLFSWFAWHVEDHELHSLNYLHTGASKTWYAVPGEAAPALEEAVRVHGYGGNLNRRAAFSLLGEKTTVMSPEVLVALGVPCCRLVQNVGEYVVTFPRAYHLGFSHGFNCGEAANFATPGWLEVAKDAAARRAAMNSSPMLSHQQLLYHLTISLPQRIPASCPSEPRSSRLKVRQRSIGEEMVKSTYLQDVTENNQLFKILLEQGVSRCVLAIDSTRPGVFNALQDESTLRGLAEQTGSGSNEMPSGVLGPELFSHFGDSSHATVQRGNIGTVQDDNGDQRPPHLSIHSTLEIESHLDASGKQFIEVESPITAAGRPVSPGILSNDGAGYNAGKDPGGTRTTTAATSLGIDWGTLPCAACGILCYASMAVVRPTASAALSFKPIFAAAGLEHCVIEVEDPRRTSSLSQLMPIHVVDRSKNLTSTAQTSGLRDPPDTIEGSLTLWNTSLQPSDKTETAAGSTQYLAPDQGIYRPGSPAEIPKLVQRNQDPPQRGQSDLGVGQLDLMRGNLDTRASFGTETALKFDVAPTLANSKRDPSPENCVDFSSLLSDSEYITQGDLDLDVLGLENAPNLEATASPPIQLTESGAIPRGILSIAYTVCSDKCGGDDDYCGAAWNGKEKQQKPAHVGQPKLPGLSSLQLLASNYDDNSDLEDEHLGVSPAESHCVGEEKITAGGKEKTVDDRENAAAHSERKTVASREEMAVVDSESDQVKGAEVCAKPDSGVGDLLSDVVGVSADVLGLTLFTVAGISNASRPNASSSGRPMFTYSSLVEGPKTLENVFISGGFSFGDGADPTSVGSLTEDGAIDGQIGEDAHVLKMEDLYDRINSQALTFDSDGEEQMMIHFGLRSDLFQEPLELGNCKNMSAGQVDCLQQQLEPSDNFPFGNDTTPDNGVSYNFAVPGNTAPPDSKSGLLAQADGLLQTSSIKPLTEKHPTEAKSDVGLLGYIKRGDEDVSTDDRSGITSGALGIGRTRTNDQSVESGVRLLQERKVSMSKACRSVARPRILCLEHAVIAQQKLKNVGGAHVVIVCHPDFEKFERRAKHLTQELEDEHTWTHVPFSRAADDEIKMISTAVHAEDEEHRKVNDWVTQMGLFVYDRFADRQIESSDESEDEAACASGRPNRVGRPRLMTSKSLPVLDGEWGADEATVDMKRSKVSKKKTCTIAGKWCGKVWRFNQVHPLLGGCKKVDPSQLGMSSTSLYSLSLMSECDGGKQRKGGSSTKIDGVRDLLGSARFLEDQPNARHRNRKRKVLDSESSFQPEKGVDAQRRLEAATLDRPPLTITGLNVEPGDHTVFPKLRTLTGIVSNAKNSNYVFEEGSMSSDVLGSSAVSLVTPGKLPILVSETDVNGLPILSPIPLSTRDSTATEHANNGLDLTGIAPGGCGIPGAALATVSGKDAAGIPVIPILNMNDLRGEPNAISLDDGVWHKTASLTNVYSTLRHGVNALNKRKKGRPPNLSSSSVGKKKEGDGSALSFVWHDAPVAYSSSMHPAMTSGRTGEHSSQLALPQSEHERVYIPDICTAQSAPVTEHPLVCEPPCNELYSSGNTFASLEEISGKLQHRGLMEGNPVVEEELGVELIEPIFDQGTGPNISSMCSSEKPALSMKHTVAVSSLDMPMSLRAQQKIDEHGQPIHLKDNSLVANSLSVLVDRVTGSDPIVNLESHTQGFPGRASDQVVLGSGVAQEIVHDVKNVVKLSGSSIDSFSSGLDGGDLSFAGHLQVCLSQDGGSGDAGSHSDPVHLRDGHVYEKAPGIELTPILGHSHCRMTSPQGTLGGNEPLVNFTEIASPSIQLENQTGTLVSRRTMSRGRSAVRARGKRPKNVGWANYKPFSSPQVPEAVNPECAWQLTLHSPSTAIIGSVGVGEFDVENSETAIVLRDEPISGAIILSEGGEASVIAEDDDEAENDEDDDVQEGPESKVHAKSKKKAKQKKKRTVPNKKALHEEGEFQCDLEGCRMSFDTEAELQIHKRNRCTFKGCGKRFFIHKYLLQHRRVHMDDRPLKCPWKGCTQSFKWAWARTEHIRVHTGERPYSCPECEQTFRFVSDFSRHKRNTGHTKQ